MIAVSRRHSRAAEASRPDSANSGPSNWNRRLLIALLAAVDFLLASHMALYQWGVIGAVWDPVFGAEQSHLVLRFGVSELIRQTFLVPDAALGAAAYLAEIILSVGGSAERWRRQPWLVVVFGINALAVALVGVALIVLQPTVVGAWCLLCLVTAVFSIAMLGLALPEVLASLGHLRRRWFAGVDSARPES